MCSFFEIKEHENPKKSFLFLDRVIDHAFGLLHFADLRSQEATSEEERTEKESQPEEPVMEKKTGRGNVRLSSTARWRRTTVTWTTLPRGSNSGKQKTSADDKRREKRTTSGTTGTKSWHCNLEDRPKIQTKETNSKAVA